MKKEVAEKWIAALRSGKYAQGKGKLRTVNDKYCCLGVLCEVLALPSKLFCSEYGYGQGGSAGLLPCEALPLSGMRDISGVLGNDPQEYLVSLNDNGVSFTEIADIIEKNWEKL